MPKRTEESLIGHPSRSETERAVPLCEFWYQGYLWLAFGTRNPEIYRMEDRSVWNFVTPPDSELLDDDDLSRLRLRKHLASLLESCLLEIAKQEGVPLVESLTPEQQAAIQINAYDVHSQAFVEDLAARDAGFGNIENPFLVGDNLERLWYRMVHNEHGSAKLPLLEELIVINN